MQNRDTIFMTIVHIC